MTKNDHPTVTPIPTTLDVLDPPVSPEAVHDHVCAHHANEVHGLVPVELWLSHHDFGTWAEVHGLAVHEDETTHPIPVLMSSLAGACREITGEYLARGFAPVDDWSVEYCDEEGNDHEVRRRFVPMTTGGDS